MAPVESTKPTPTPSAKAPLLKLVPLETVQAYDRSLQVRGEIDPAKVLAYREIIRDNGGVMDPVVVFYETSELGGGPRWLADGFHRVDAYAAEKTEKIPTRFIQGTRSDALKFAIRENGHHGAQMSNAQKRHAATMAVLDPVLGELADADIAKMVGCSPSLVSDCRRGETAEQKTSKRAEKASRKTGASGKRETESTAPKSATARERKQEDARPTATMILKGIEDHVDREVIDEHDVVKIFETGNGQYSFVSKPGQITTLKVVGKSGRVQIEIPVMVRELKFEQLILKNEGPKLQVIEEEE